MAKKQQPLTKIQGISDKHADILIAHITKELDEGEEVPNNLEGFQYYILEAGQSLPETIDHNFIYTTYRLKIGDLYFCVDGSEYRKDGGTCPFEFDDEIYTESAIKKKPVKNVPKINVLITTKNFKAIEKEAKAIPGYNQTFFTKLWTTLKKKELAK